MIDNEFVIPKWVQIEENTDDGFARFVVEPFERGYGTTIGNSLRRVLLASLHGSAVTALKIEGVNHEFAAVPGVAEDVTDIVLALKRCQLRLNQKEALIFTTKLSKNGVVTAGDLFKDSPVDCFTPDLPVMTITDPKAEIEITLKVDSGRGYVTADQLELEHAELGTVYLDANFSPVLKVNFFVEDARVGQTTDYDRLILEVWTNGSIPPQEAMQEASNLIIDHLRIFVQQRTEEDVAEAAEALGAANPELAGVLGRTIDDLELSVRASNCLKAADIRSIGDLVSYEESQMLGFHNFGKKSLDEIKAVLLSMGLELGMLAGQAGTASAAALAGAPEATEEAPTATIEEAPTEEA